MKKQNIKKKVNTFSESFDNARITKTRSENAREIDLYIKKCSNQFNEAKRLALRTH